MFLTAASVAPVVSVAREIGRLAENALPPWLFLELMSHVPSAIHHIVGRCLRISCNPLSVDSLANYYQIDRATLYRIMKRHRGPGPQSLIGLCRSAQVCARLDESATTIANLAERLRFPDDISLRMHVKRTLDTRTTTLRGAGCRAIRVAWQAAFAPKMAS